VMRYLFFNHLYDFWWSDFQQREKFPTPYSDLLYHVFIIFPD
jgi:hypothetical protein